MTSWKFITHHPPIKVSQGYLNSHDSLGGVLNFCAAAHLLHLKTKESIKVSFDPSKKNLVKYFTGLQWVTPIEIPNAIDCSAVPISEEWPTANSVKLFYKLMDSSMNPPKTFDIYFNISAPATKSKIIGLITHSNMHGDIDIPTLNRMVAEARTAYPHSRIVCIGDCESILLPCGVEDWRQKDYNIDRTIDTVRQIDLLLTPQSELFYIAAGFRIPMWVYRNNSGITNYAINYDNYKVEKWFDCPIINI